MGLAAGPPFQRRARTVVSALLVVLGMVACGVATAAERDTASERDTVDVQVRVGLRLDREREGRRHLRRRPLRRIARAEFTISDTITIIRGSRGSGRVRQATGESVVEELLCRSTRLWTT
jgi:hypothetical protein